MPWIFVPTEAVVTVVLFAATWLWWWLGTTSQSKFEEPPREQDETSEAEAQQQYYTTNPDPPPPPIRSVRSSKTKGPTPLSLIRSPKLSKSTTHPDLAETILTHEAALENAMNQTPWQRASARWQTLVASLSYKKRREAKANAARFSKGMPRQLDTRKPTGSTDHGARWGFREIRSFW